MKFAKKFNTFDEGIKELAQVSFSAEQALTWQTGRLPSTEEEAVKNLAVNVALDRPTANGVDWDACAIKISAFGTEYKTGGGLTFGWEVVLGASQMDTFGGEYIFFVEHPNGKAPEDSTLRQSATEHGWEEKSDMMVGLEGATKFI